MNQPTDSDQPRPEPFVRESVPRLADFAADLLWPRLFQSVGLALRPERIGLAFFGLVGAMVVGSIAETRGLDNATYFVLRELGAAFSSIAAGLFGLDAGPIAAGTGGLLSLPARLWAAYGWWSPLLHIPAVLILALAGCAICRMAACDFSQGVLLSWTEGLGFAVRKITALAAAIFAPLILVALLAAGIALGGTLLAWPAVNILGAIFYGLFLLVAAVAVLVLAAWALGLPLLIPAVACEGSDGIDAIQRAFAYVLGRPLRLLIFAAIALLICWFASLVASRFAIATHDFAKWASTGISGADGAVLIPQPQIGGGPDGAAFSRPPEIGAAPLTGPDRAAAAIIRFWTAIPVILVWAVALSLFFCASTIVYLLIRQVADGQDWGELWMPGMIEGTMAQALAARAAAGGHPESGGPTRIGVPERRPAGQDEDD